MSPFLFVLVMEALTLIIQQLIEQNGGFSYHWKYGLTTFAELSGLQANLEKSHLILSHSAGASRDTLLAILNFQERHLPIRYLGLPLLASRLTIADCQPILQKIDAHIKGWEGVMFSFAGRVQLIKSVLSALQVYWAMAFILPKHIIKEIEKRLRNFLWRGSLERGYAKIAWQMVCRPVNEGGLGIRDIQALNRGLMSRHLWRIITHDSTSIWVTWIFQYRLQNYSIWTISARAGTWGWRKMIRLRDTLRPYIRYQIGEGTSFSLWHDPWNARGPLILQFPSGPRHTSIPISAPLSTVIWDESWVWTPITDMESVDITHDLPTIHGGRDRILWTGPRGSFSSAAAYDVFRPSGPTVDWSSLLVGTFHIPRHWFILWLAIQDRLSTRDKPWLQHLGSACVLCREGLPESHEHMFFMCSFVSECIHAIRRERESNIRVFQHMSRTPDEIARIVVSEIRDLIISKQLPRTISTRAADGDTSDAIPPPNVDDQSRATPPPGLNPKDFNLGEFIALANRVVDVGDVESVAALVELKRRWVERFGDGGMTTPAVGWKPVASCQPTPFPAPARAPRRAIRHVIPTGGRISHTPMLTTRTDDAAAIGGLPNSEDETAPPTRVSGDRSDHMQIRVPPLAPPIENRNDPIDVEGDLQLTVSGGRPDSPLHPSPIAIWDGGIVPMCSATPEVFIPAAAVAPAPTLPRSGDAADSPQPPTTTDPVLVLPKGPAHELPKPIGAAAVERTDANGLLRRRFSYRR
ncbi:UNVERIFIED_CONTAM: hypothetical protein Sradi_3619500 [Sesamum radiatum]|uniref:Reverse transcriptase zinc-binding domain-containing protein n=1 Tax=Sesamum radiatum TaxID=300843 RepID=A0AAW2QHL0_SESRA